ncbi:MAG: hypothetical protein ACK55Z_29085, partial [bacterium]
HRSLYSHSIVADDSLPKPHLSYQAISTALSTAFHKSLPHAVLTRLLTAKIPYQFATLASKTSSHLLIAAETLHSRLIT